MDDTSRIKVGLKYARSVVSGRIPVCKWVKLACKRHLDDLKASKNRAFPYQFDEKKAARAIAFIENMPHMKGEWASRGELMVLQPWQIWWISCVFGWVFKDSGLRRFRKVLIMVPRKNGKSVVAALIGLFMLACDGEAGAEVYSGATSRDQSNEVFRPARIMAMKSPPFLEFYGVEVNASNINVLSTASKFEPLIGKPGDGASPSCAIHDEYHEHQTDSQVAAMETGMASRRQPLQLIISTAGANLAGPCFAAQKDAQKVLEGTLKNDHLFTCIWTIDEGDRWDTVAALKKANPNFGVSVNANNLKADLQEAKQIPRKQSAYKTKHLNMWVSAMQAFFNVEKWRACARPELKLEDFRGQPCWLGVDLASKIDLAAMEILFRLDECDCETAQKLVEEGVEYARFGRYWLPEATVELPENEHYRAWAIEKWLNVTDGDIIDFNEIKDEVLDLSLDYQINRLAYDPAQATMLMTELQDEGMPVVDVRPTVLNFCQPMRVLEGLIASRRIVHDGDPVMTWAVSNVVAKEDAKDNVYPRKETREQKIDPVVAHLMAMNRAQLEAGAGPDIYESEGLARVRLS